MKHLVIFDLDGTLLDTIRDLAEAANHTLDQLSLPKHSLEAYRNMVGNGIEKLLERAMPQEERNPDIILMALKIFKDYYNSHLTDYSVPYPGIREMLKDLSARGINLAVTSNKYQEAVTEIITTVFPEIEFKAILGKQEGIPAKPDPSIVFEVLAKVPTPKAEVLYVGDSGVDMETAMRACVESVGVTWGFRPVRELRAANADHIVNSPADIVDIALNSRMS